MNIILTGATSFIGRAVSEELIARGHNVYAMIRPDSKHQENLPNYSAFHRIMCDMENCEKLTDMDLPHMDVCIHFAWEGVGREGRADRKTQAENVKNTLILLSVSGLLGCSRFLFAGSQAEYGVTLERVRSGARPYDEITEETKCLPISEYGMAKLMVLRKAAGIADLADMTYLHMRIFSVYGPDDHDTSLVSSCIKAFMKNEKIRLSQCEQMWNYLYVTDAAHAVADLAECTFMFSEGPDGVKNEEHVINIAGTDTRPLREFVQIIKTTIGGKGDYTLEERPASLEGTPWLRPSTEKLRKLTDFKQQVTFVEGVRNIEKMYSMRGKTS